MNYIDFIDSPAVRDHLRTLPPLPPAQQCILIAQSQVRSLADKLAALREIREATPPEEFSRGCWKFQCEDPFPAILDRYIRTREERLAMFDKAEPSIVYVAETFFWSQGCGTPFTTFKAALASIGELEDDEWLPSIRRFRIDDDVGAVLVVNLTKNRKIRDIDVERDGDEGEMHDRWAGDLPSGFAHVPHPFRRGDLVRQGKMYYVIDKGAEERSGRHSWGTDADDMQIPALSWDEGQRTFSHAHLQFTRCGLDYVAPANLPKEQRVLAAVSLLLQGKNSITGFLEAFTNRGPNWQGDNAMEVLENGSMADIPPGWEPIPKNDLPGLSANIFVMQSRHRVESARIRVQRNIDAKPRFRDSEELTLEAEPSFLGGAGDLSAGDIGVLRDFVARNLDPLRAYWDGLFTFDDLIAKLRGDGPAALKTEANKC